MDNMTTAAYMSGRSSSASSTGTGSSTGGGTGSGSAGDGRMAVIGVTRNVRLRRGYPGFGFAIRGGLEYGAGFYVSDVEPGGEAHRMGLRVGDQIIRMNGHPVEDAVHREIALLAKHRQDLVLKIRSVGMIPVKDNPNDPVTWHMVQQQQQQQQQLHLQHQHPQYKAQNPPPYNQVRLRIHVGEKGKLGCGVCRGVVPGLTVQGTREGGPARAAGLKAGDVIIWCNGQRLTNIPFERAIEVMRGADVLEVVVNRPISGPTHPPYDCPAIRAPSGISSYDMTRSFGPYNNPPAGIINLKGGWPMSMSTGSCSSSDWGSPVDQGADWSRKPNNTTVIRVNHNNTTSGYPLHPAYRQNHTSGAKPENEEPLYDPVAPRDYESHDFDANPGREERNHRDNGPTYDSPMDERALYNISKDHRPDNRLLDGQSIGEIKTVTTVEVHQTSGYPPAPPPCMPPPMPHKWQSESKGQIMGMGMQMGSTLSMGSTGSTETESSLESCGKDSASTSSSVSTSSCEPASTVSYASSVPAPPPNAGNVVANKIQQPEVVPVRPPVVPAPPPPCTDLGTAITQELARRAQLRMLKAAAEEAAKENSSETKKSPNPEALRAQENKITHDKLMEEFKRAHRRMFNGNLQRVQFSDEQNMEKEQEKRVRQVITTNGGIPPPPPLPVGSAVKKSPEDTVEMQSIESFKLKEAPSPIVPKPPSTYFSATGSPRHRPPSPPIFTVNNNNNSEENSRAQIANPGPIEEKMPKIGPMSTFGPGKVAVRIGAYEGESKQPSRLDFLPQPPPRASSEEATDGPVVSRLQNELAATLQRSNLRKQTEVENTAMKKPIECQSTTRISAETEGPSLLQSSVEKLAAALASNRVTIKVSPENSAR